MSSPLRRVLVGGAAVLLLAVAVFFWRSRGPSEEQVRRTVVTTVQEETPASVLVTGTLHLRVTVTMDSSQYLTPNWVTGLLQMTQPGVLPLLAGRSETQVRIPGRVSYGFDVQQLEPSMIRFSEGSIIDVTVPALSVQSVAPDLARLEVQRTNQGWMRVFPSDLPEAVRKRALADAERAFRRQAEQRLKTTTQPRVNTARALEAALRPPLQAAGIRSPQFRIRIGERLVLRPED